MPLRSTPSVPVLHKNRLQESSRQQSKAELVFNMHPQAALPPKSVLLINTCFKSILFKIEEKALEQVAKNVRKSRSNYLHRFK